MEFEFSKKEQNGNSEVVKLSKSSSDGFDFLNKGIDSFSVRVSDSPL